ncbi:3-deoxy-D-manno-octulosonic acid transferase [Paracandidimonas soli]|uniref:3-deoxy-D-manno-octulosonic acid transferase n=1 Tax=Paracandidimonas soli TaxID=1917182 RepID=A0A4R3VG82_9BURK|nr:3-deoxy-D-manno-octulosonic acid transferase [Paracandidimonas soli]TCV03033.1 3-deoxy-D-manno-octulosonic-acid transferase [Paracandidimonas soli]
MNRTIYTLLLRCLSPVLLSWMWLRARKAGGQWGVFSGRRFGFYPGKAVEHGQADIWVHAVSLGETRAAQPLVRELLAGGRRILLTHMTATGREEGGRLFAEAIADGRLVQEWLPYDFPGSMRRFLGHYRPKVGVLMEREVWPNLMASAQMLAIPMVLASARMSENSARRTAKAGGIMRGAYDGIRMAYAQTETDAERLRRAGVKHVRVYGNFKFDMTLPEEQIRAGREFAGRLPMPIISIASTREGEDALFVQAIRQQRTDAVLQKGGDLLGRVLFMLIPRHPQRFAEVEGMLEDSGLPFLRWSDISAQEDPASSCRDVLVVLGDTIGDMARHYSASAVSIVAGSFAPLGGQNLIEACAAGAPVIVGPHTWNFAQAAEDAIGIGAAQRAENPEQALVLAMQWLEDEALRASMSQRGREWVQAHAGAAQRVASQIMAI